MPYASEQCRLECERRGPGGCGFGHCDRFLLEQQNPDLVPVDSAVFEALVGSLRALASGTYVSGPLLDRLVAARKHPGV